MEHQKTYSRWIAALQQTVAVVLLALALIPDASAEEPHATQPQDTLVPRPIIQDGKISLTLREVPISEVMEMLSRTSRTNILLSEGVIGMVSVNLYNVDTDEAIHSIARAAGFEVEQRKGSYFIVRRNEVGKHAPGGPTQLRTFKVQYSDPDTIAGILENYLSSFGQITTLPERKLLVVEDTPHFIDRIATLLAKLDITPMQILIEAKILEIGLKDTESFGLDWARLFEPDNGTGSFGVQGLSNPGSPGLFFDIVTPDVELFLDSLRTRDRLRTLSTPKILALEDREAETIIGDRLGYNVTTTIDGVTTTSVEYLESGVILKVKPSVDEQNRVLLDIHPEVSTGSVSDDGIPNQTTTEVTTTMLVDSGQTAFIGGLIKRSAEETREGVPVLGDLPVLGGLFSNRALSSINTELVVLITPYIIDHDKVAMDQGQRQRVNGVAQDLEVQPTKIDRNLEKMDYFEDMIERGATEAPAARNDDTALYSIIDD
jgi:type II secretory pathway component GspD/PulD (secretin)